MTISSPTTPSVVTPPATPATGTPLFGTVLVANRGEIACRVIRTLRALGIRSVAVYSDADAGARHVREADVAVRIGPAAATESYLKIEAIIQACRDTGAEAVHPGYGFLSENVDFARALEKAGITFIGPGVESLNVMGDKIRSKNHVTGYGVPVVPGIAEPGMTDAQLIEAAAGVGFPLLIKPSAGGGGKGMHIVERAEDLEATLTTARRVAASAFGDDTLFLERLVLTPRHIEVQVLADNHGNVIHLGERECSLQRRHQKVIEEAPSPLLESLPDGAAIRARLGEAACNAARSVNYSGAGTVEFLVSDNAPDEFFFMEMNTRLQVEHPVTEMVTGIDLVEWQVRIAAGEELTVAQDDVVLTGHSVEARVYAEIPEKNFLPSGGEVLLLDERGSMFTAMDDLDSVTPAGADPDIRIDSSLMTGLEISSDYDPMVSKVIAWGEDRAAALDKLDTRAYPVHRPGHRHQRRIPAAADQRCRRPRRPARHRPDRAENAGLHVPPRRRCRAHRRSHAFLGPCRGPGDGGIPLGHRPRLAPGRPRTVDHELRRPGCQDLHRGRHLAQQHRPRPCPRARRRRPRTRGDGHWDVQ